MDAFSGWIEIYGFSNRCISLLSFRLLRFTESKCEASHLSPARKL